MEPDQPASSYSNRIRRTHCFSAGSNLSSCLQRLYFLPCRQLRHRASHVSRYRNLEFIRLFHDRIHHARSGSLRYSCSDPFSSADVLCGISSAEGLRAFHGGAAEPSPALAAVSGALFHRNYSRRIWIRLSGGILYIRKLLKLFCKLLSKEI